jgi:hypothetical protein
MPVPLADPARRDGWAVSDQEFEDGIHPVAGGGTRWPGFDIAAGLSPISGTDP